MVNVQTHENSINFHFITVPRGIIRQDKSQLALIAISTFRSLNKIIELVFFSFFFSKHRDNSWNDFDRQHDYFERATDAAIWSITLGLRED